MTYKKSGFADGTDQAVFRLKDTSVIFACKLNQNRDTYMEICMVHIYD